MAGKSPDGGETPLNRSAREIIRMALITIYRVPARDAAGLESELFVWFDRLHRRPGAPATITALRGQLVSMACRVAHIYWTGQGGENLARDQRVERTIALGPEIVAAELESRLAKKSSRGGEES